MQNNSKVNFNKLSPRENEVAFLIVNGLSTTVIASKLGIKSNTVSSIKKKIFIKLSVDSVVGLYKKLNESKFNNV
jgi:DNA-binding NarL/FixJ family response regulator